MSTHTFLAGVRYLGLLVGFGVVLAATPAQAQLSVCNKSTETVSIAVAYRSQGQSISRGWFIAKPGECPAIVGGPLENRYYYVRGEGAAGTEWSGTFMACTSKAKYSYAGESACEAGFERAGFFQIDTGDNTGWTHNLTIGTPSSAAAVHEGIASLRIGWRRSALDNSIVMQVHNPSRSEVQLRMQCFTTGGDSKFLQVSIPASGMSEVGFLQGWPGNFVPGERCDAYHGDEKVWQVTAPRL